MRREREPKKYDQISVENLWLPASAESSSIAGVPSWVAVSAGPGSSSVITSADGQLGLEQLLASGYTLQDICKKSWVLRRVLESMGREFDENLGVVVVDEDSTPDIEHVVLDINMSMGACGFVVEQYPVPTFATAILIRILDRALAKSNSCGGVLHVDD